MPELPEVETVKRGLENSLKGSDILSVQVLRVESVAHPTAALFCRKLKGKKFLEFERKGKYLLIRLSGNCGLMAHLRMSGRLLVMDLDADEPEHTRVRFSVSGGRKLIFDDTRVFGRLWYCGKDESFEQVLPALAEIGPEPLEHLGHEYLLEKFSGKTQSIKIALLDQRIIAGVGNIYADESLHRAGIHPARAAGSIGAQELKRLCKEIQAVLAQAIEQGGSTLRDYTDSAGVNGNYQHEALVYGRKGQNCRSCASKIERIKLAGRSTHFCPCCQSESI